MKKIVPLLVLVCLLIGIAIIDSCKKEDVIPTLTTTTVTNITVNSGTTGGMISKDGGAAVTARGVCWGTTSSPAISGSHTSDDNGAGSFTSNLTGLTPNTLYHVRAYATNKVGTAYGNEVTFTTSPIVIPTVTTTAVSSITLTTAVSGGNITSDGNAAIIAKGVCWATTATPTVKDSTTISGTGAGSFISNLTGLQPGITYYVRAYATNSAGTAYGNELSFTTSPVAVATLTTTTATLVTLTTAVSGGNITADGGGAITARGVSWATSANPDLTNSITTDGTGTGSFISNLSGLLPGTIYHIRAYATNSAGTAYGNDLTFTTNLIVVPTLTTATVTSITLTSAVSGGNIVADGGGSVTARGICWATTTGPTVLNSITTDGIGTGSFTSNLTGLTAATVYYVRAYATNSAGTAYGNEVSFTSGQIVVPTLTTTAITSITSTTAISGGNVFESGGATITGRGVCWATTANPTIGNSVTNDGTGTGSFTSNLTGLTPATTYHLRAYAVNSAGTAYGNEVVFTTATALPTLTTTTVTSITTTTATSGGNITADGGGAVTVRGVCWATTANPTISNSKTTDGTGIGIFTSSLTSLLPSTVYHVRSYATNSAGTVYGNDVSFTTSTVLIPTLTTVAITSITTTTAVSGGNITADGGGAVTARGVCWSTSINPTISDTKSSDGTGSGAYTSNLTGLIPGTIYHVRAYATNSAGTAYGNDVSFTSVATAVPSIATTAISAIDVTTAVSGGNIALAGAGTISARGVCWSTTTGPVVGGSHTTDGSGTGSFTSNLTSLLPGLTYYVRAYATNNVGTGYGNEISFNTKIADIEGNKYATVTIGTQVWMSENLKTSKYNTGASIPTTTTVDLTGETAPKYQWIYNDDNANLATYGRLYTFYAITDPAGVCPTGMHVPSDAEWITLSNFLINNGFAFTSGGQDIGKSMASTSGWTTDPTAGNVGNNQATNNTSGFSAVPAGFRKSNTNPVVWNELGFGVYFRSSTEDTPPGSWYYYLRSNSSLLGRASYASFNGYSVRCVK